MPIYMDVHIIPGVKARAVAEAHTLDLLHQEEYGCKCMTYWIDETRESVFCLIEAPDKDAVKEMHRQAHGLIPSKIIEVSSSVVQSFLGRIFDPEEAEVSAQGLKVFSDPSYRMLLVTKTKDPVLLRHCMGNERAATLLDEQNKIIRQNAATYGGTEVEQGGTGFIISFNSAVKAVSCALAIQQDLPAAHADTLDFKISINGGEPIAKSNRLFGDTIQLAQFMCVLAGSWRIAITSSVREMVSKERFQENDIISLSPPDEALLEQIFITLEEHWQDPEFDVEDCCRALALSKSQLYRKTMALTGMPPHSLLKEYRLEKARELMKKRNFSIAQITFEAGFSSPSYFTKCFKKKFGLLPGSYMELLQ